MAGVAGVEGVPIGCCCGVLDPTGLGPTVCLGVAIV